MTHGARTIVLLPGLDGSGVLFRPLVGALPGELRPQVVSYPGDQPLGYDELLIHVLDRLPKNEPFVVLGESFSGPLAVQVGARRPSGLEAIVLCATFVRCPLPFGRPGLAPLIRPLPFRLFPLFTRIKSILGGISSPALRALSKEALADVRPEVLAHRVREVFRVDARQDLLASAVPVLYLRGTRDLVVPARNLREILRLKPTVQVARIPAPHLLLQAQPGLAAAAIAGFLERSVR